MLSTDTRKSSAADLEVETELRRARRSGSLSTFSTGCSSSERRGQKRFTIEPGSSRIGASFVVLQQRQDDPEDAVSGAEFRPQFLSLENGELLP